MNLQVFPYMSWFPSLASPSHMRVLWVFPDDIALYVCVDVTILTDRCMSIKPPVESYPSVSVLRSRPQQDDLRYLLLPFPSWTTVITLTPKPAIFRSSQRVNKKTSKDRPSLSHWSVNICKPLRLTLSTDSRRSDLNDSCIVANQI